MRDLISRVCDADQYDRQSREVITLGMCLDLYQVTTKPFEEVIQVERNRQSVDGANQH